MIIDPAVWFLIGLVLGLLIRAAALWHSDKQKPKLKVVQGGKNGKKWPTKNK
jgi:hypothetical protein